MMKEQTAAEKISEHDPFPGRFFKKWTRIKLRVFAAYLPC
jgi:hypothetical protein